MPELTRRRRGLACEAKASAEPLGGHPPACRAGAEGEGRKVFRYSKGRPLRRQERLDMTPKIKEHTCPACNGTGFPIVMQPVRPGRKIYPVKCESCDGKGKITDVN